MRNVLPVLLLGISIFGHSEEEGFRPRNASEYQARQTISQVTIAAEVYETEEQAKPVFGKNHPNRYGVLPILIVIENNSDNVISLRDLRVEYRYRNGQTIEATPATDVPYLRGPNRPSISPPSPIPGGGRATISRKNPLNNPQIEARAFAARMLPPKDSANGFFYFRGGHTRDSILYVTGLREAGSGKELFFYEIPLAAPR